MGLTEMGEIKQQLYAEAEADDAALAAQAEAIPAAARATDPEVLARLAAIEAQLAAIASAVGTQPAAPPVPAAREPDIAALITPDAAEATLAPVPPVPPAAPAWRDEVSYTLAPTEGIEIKLVMEEGAEAEFAWTANGSVLNFDTHGDGGGQRISYEQGRGVPGQEGTLVAAFTGNHGWFWRNRTDEQVTVTVRTRGDYSELRKP